MTPKIWWYLARSSGLIAWSLAGARDSDDRRLATRRGGVGNRSRLCAASGRSVVAHDAAHPPSALAGNPFPSYAVWIGGTVHALEAGTDQGATRIIAIVSSALIFNLSALRIVGRKVPRSRVSSPRTAALSSRPASPGT